MLNPLQESLFQSLFDHLPEPRIVVKANAPEFTVVACNKQYKIVSRTTGKDIIGKSMREIHGYNDANADGDTVIRIALNRAIESREKVKLSAVRYDLPSAAGNTTEESWWQAEYVPILGENGQVAYIMCTTHNITEQVAGLEAAKKAKEQQEALQREHVLNEELAAANQKLAAVNQELQQWQQGLELLVQELEARVEIRTQELAESEAKARYIINNAPVAIGVLAGKEMIIEIANDKILKAWGKSEAIIGKPLHLAIPELKGQPNLQLLDDVFTTGKPYFGKEAKVFFERDGALIESYFNFVYQPHKNKAGNTARIIVAAHNVTEQVNARKDLEKAQDILKLAIDAAGIGIWNADLTTGFLTFSEQGRIMHGVPEGVNLKLTDAAKMIAEDYRNWVLENIKKALRTKNTFQDTYLLYPMDNSKAKWVKSHGKIYYDEQGKALYVSGAVMDITEQKQDDLRKNDFIGMVSHELKTPLTTIGGFIYMLQLKAKKAEDVFTTVALEKVNVQVKKMGAMINGFLNVSRLESGKIYLEKQDFIFHRLVQDLIQESKILVSSHTIILFPCDPVKIYADKDKIGNVISNLLSNAIKYSPKGKTIEVKCVLKENIVQLSVKDEGMGIEQQHLENLFNRFYRIESPQTKSIAGFGIGLYLCAEIIERHEGKIWVESEIGKGSTFHFSLPVK